MTCLLFITHQDDLSSLARILFFPSALRTDQCANVEQQEDQMPLVSDGVAVCGLGGMGQEESTACLSLTRQLPVLLQRLLAWHHSSSSLTVM